MMALKNCIVAPENKMMLENKRDDGSENSIMALENSMMSLEI